MLKEGTSMKWPFQILSFSYEENKYNPLVALMTVHEKLQRQRNSISIFTGKDTTE